MIRSEAVEVALDPMKTMLMADGYALDIRLDGPLIEVAVSATPDACAECLVPKEMFATMAADLLTRGGVRVDATTLSVRYPADQ